MLSSSSPNGAATHGTLASTARIKNATACLRCRQKKKRCDQKLPRCHLCETAGVECFGYDSVARRQVPRSFIHGLEERIAYLESRLREHGIPDQDHGASQQLAAVSSTAPSPLDETVQTPEDYASQTDTDELTAYSTLQSKSSDHESAAKGIADGIIRLTQRKPGPEPSISKIILTELMRSKMATPIPKSSTAPQDQDTADPQLLSDVVGDLDTRPVSLPAKETAKSLVNRFFQSALMGLPLLHEPTFMQKFDALYALPRIINLTDTHATFESRIATFFVLEVFAIALLSMQRDLARAPIWLADRYHKTAVAALIEASLPIDVEGVQALLLIAQYSYLHPTVWAAWKTLGTALCLAAELGLHLDPPADEFDFFTRDSMRRTFWVAYAMDRNIAISLNLPSSLSDGAISAQFPSEVEDRFITPGDAKAPDDTRLSNSKRISRHMLGYRQIQSEMRSVLSERPPPPYTPVNLDKWQQNMRDRIMNWSRSFPACENLNYYEMSIIESFEVNQNTALFYLYRPSNNIPSPSGAQLLTMAQAASKMIELYRKFYRERKLTIYWQAVENLSSAGTGLLFAYVHSQQVRDHVPFRSLRSLVHTCSSVLWGMVEHFHAFKGKRDAFDMTASKVLADISGDTWHEARTDQLLLPGCGTPDSPANPEMASGDDRFAASRAERSLLHQDSYDVRPQLSAINDAPRRHLQPGLSPSATGDNVFTYDHLETLNFTNMDDLSAFWEAADINETFPSS